MGRALQDARLYREALIHYNQALVLDPKAESAWYQRGNTLLAIGREQEALEAFDQVEALAPDDEGAMNKIAAIRRQLKARRAGNE
ncbi:MAG: tetratricopeptide repeat protein [Gammaproteobacteria bacterium]|nr:tetratricopeptide repeat protein [Gammaproteobacteria bacterium]